MTLFAAPFAAIEAEELALVAVVPADDADPALSEAERVHESTAAEAATNTP